MLPPFYYKGVTDDGLFAAYARIIDAVGDARLRIVLYHIPQVSGVPLSRALVARLIAAFPEIVVGIKEPAGTSQHQAIAAAHAGFAVLAGADPLLLPLLRSGGAGCITATSNLIADSLRVVYDAVDDPARVAAVEAAQARINAWRSLSNSYVAVPTIKAMLGLQTGNAGWNRVRPPMLPLNAAEFATLQQNFDALPYGAAGARPKLRRGWTACCGRSARIGSRPSCRRRRCRTTRPTSPTCPTAA